MIAITVLIKNRAWILPSFFDYLEGIAYPKHDIVLMLVNDASTDDSRAYLQTFCETRRVEGAYKQIFFLDIPEQFDGNTSSRDPVTRTRQELYVHLASLRNTMIAKIHEIEQTHGIHIDYQLSLDSDVLVHPGILNHLLDTMGALRNQGYQCYYLSSVVLNHSHADDKFTYDIDLPAVPRNVNFGNIVSRETFGHGMRRQAEVRYEQFGWQPNMNHRVDISGACYLIDRVALDTPARYDGHPLGEDVAYCMDLHKFGVWCWANTTWASVHVMRPEWLQDGLAAYQRMIEQTTVQSLSPVAPPAAPPPPPLGEQLDAAKASTAADPMAKVILEPTANGCPAGMHTAGLVAVSKTRKRKSKVRK